MASFLRTLLLALIALVLAAPAAQATESASSEKKIKEETQSAPKDGEDAVRQEKNMMVGIIGGTGLNCPGFFEQEEEREVETPYGFPSSSLIIGKVKGTDIRVVFLERHGKGHVIPPHKVNYRANIYALKEVGCKCILTSAACGSLREKFAPGSLVLPDQFVDATRRSLTFFDTMKDGSEHTPMTEPFSKELRDILVAAAKKSGHTVHNGGTMVCIEGPRFSTRAESRMYRALDCDLINMTISSECILANELHIPYATLAMVTDYDSWNDKFPPLSYEDIMRTFNENVKNLTEVLKTTLSSPMNF